MNDFYDVLSMHTKFGFPTGTPEDRPLPPATHTVLVALGFRFSFLDEELHEFMDSFEQGDLVGTVDALTDLVYVAYGTFLFWGVNPRRLVVNSLRIPSWAKMNLSVKLGTGLLSRPPQLPSWEIANLFCRDISLQIEDLARELPSVSLEDRSFMVFQNLTNILSRSYQIAAVMGVPWEPCWDAVHLANMQKILAKPDGSNSKRGVAMDLVKPEGWVGPEAKIKQALIDAGAVL